MVLNTIRNKVLIYFLLASALVIGIYGFITYNLVRKNLESEMEGRLVTAGEIIADAVKPKDIPYLKLKGKVYEFYRERLTKLKDLTEVRDILIIDGEKKILLSTLEESDKFLINLDRFEIEKTFEGEVSSSPLYKGPDGLYYKTGYVPLEDGDDVPAVIGVEASVEYLKYINQYGQLMVVIGLISFVIAMMLSIVISRGISTRIDRLKEKAEQIAKRNFNEDIKVSGEEEINLLAKTLDSMKYELKEYVENREKMASVGEFSAGIAHEIRNSLGALSGYAELIREKTTDEKIKKFADDIVQNAMKMSEFLNNFLAYTKEFKPDFQETGLQALADETIAELPEAAAAVIKKSYGGAPVPVKVDAYLIKKALYNIIMNAYQSLDKKEGVVEIFIVKDAARNVVTVKDNGRGMPAEIREKIFQPFFTGRKEGTGLGLAISYRIIKEIHGGEITVESVEGRGTEIKIIL